MVHSVPTISERLAYKASLRRVAVRRMNRSSGAEGVAVVGACSPHSAEFFVGEDTRTGLRTSTLHPFHNWGTESVAAGGMPIKHAADVAKNFVRHHRPIVILNLVEGAAPRHCG